MLPLIQAGLGILQAKKQDDEAKKQNQIAAYMGEAPTAEGGNVGKAVMGAIPGMLSGMGGGKKPGADAAPPKIGGPGMYGVDDVYGSGAGGTPIVGSAPLGPGGVNPVDDSDEYL